MKDLFIFGAGGFAREVAWLVETINQKKIKWNILGFLDENKNNHGKSLNGYDVVGGIDFLKNYSENVGVVLAIGNPKSKKTVYDKIINIKKIFFPNLIHPDVSIHNTNKLGEGNIICKGTILTININIGDHVIINLDSTVGHDAIINSFSTVLPSVNISGGVKIKEGVMLGTNSAIIQNKTIGNWTKIGAGAIVAKDIPANCTAVGIPAKPIN